MTSTKYILRRSGVVTRDVVTPKNEFPSPEGWDLFFCEKKHNATTWQLQHFPPSSPSLLPVWRCFYLIFCSLKLVNYTFIYSWWVVFPPLAWFCPLLNSPSFICNNIFFSRHVSHSHSAWPLSNNVFANIKWSYNSVYHLFPSYLRSTVLFSRSTRSHQEAESSQRTRHLSTSTRLHFVPDQHPLVHGTFNVNPIIDPKKRVVSETALFPSFSPETSTWNSWAQ